MFTLEICVTNCKLYQGCTLEVKINRKQKKCLHAGNFIRPTPLDILYPDGNFRMKILIIAVAIDEAES